MENELNTTQNADQIAYEINFIRQQAFETVLAASIQIGERLCNAKELVPHGQWGDWLKEKVNYSQKTAENLMRIYKEYGDEQILLSGSSNSKSISILSYTQAVALFALPEPARGELLSENNVPDMTIKELRQAIAEKKEAIKAQKQAEKQAEELQKLNTSLAEQVEELQSQATQPQPIMPEDEFRIALKNLSREKEIMRDEADKQMHQEMEQRWALQEKYDKLEAENQRIIAEYEQKLKEAENSTPAEIQIDEKAVFKAYFTTAYDAFNRLLEFTDKAKDKDNYISKITIFVQEVMKNVKTV